MKFRQTLFWDVNPKKIDVKKNARYIIERILNFGDENDVKWMFENYKMSLIKQVLSTSRDISYKGVNFWAHILKVPKNKILCLKPSYRKMRKLLWPY